MDFEKLTGLGIGTWGIGEDPKNKKDEIAAIRYGLDNGLNIIDTAEMYGDGKSEELIGEAIKDYDRDKLFLISKFYPYHATPELERKSLEASLERLGTDYLDLYLLHWPGTNNDFIPQWQALETLYKDKRVKSIGVSNFHVHHLDKLLAETTIVPTVNQIELNPLQTQQKVRAYCLEKGIQIEAWSPLMNAAVLDNATLKTIASKYNKTTAQIILRWQVQTNIVTIPKSMTPSRIAENAQIFDFELDGEDILLIENLNENGHYGPDPENFDFGR